MPTDQIVDFCRGSLILSSGMLALATLPEAFLVLWATEHGVGNAAIPLLWMLAHACKSILAYAAGDLSDRLGRVAIVAAGWSGRIAVMLLIMTLGGRAACGLVPFHSLRRRPGLLRRRGTGAHRRLGAQRPEGHGLRALSFGRELVRLTGRHRFRAAVGVARLEGRLDDGGRHHHGRGRGFLSHRVPQVRLGTSGITRCGLVRNRVTATAMDVLIHNPARRAVVVGADRLCFQLRRDARGELFAEFDAPLIEGIDPPDHSFDEGLMLIGGDQGAQRLGSQFLVHQGVAWFVPGEHLVR